MTKFNPKKTLEKAKEDERAGRKGPAASSYALLAAYLLREKRFPDAQKMVARALALSPQSTRLHLQQATIAMALSRESEAVDSMIQFSRLAFRKKKVEQYQAVVEAELEAFPKLRRVFYAELLSLDRTSATHFIGLARAHIDLADWGSAQAILVDAIRNKTGEEDVLPILVQVLRARKANTELEHLKSYREGSISREDVCSLLSGNSAPEAESEADPLPAAFDDIADEEKNLKTLISELVSEIGMDLSDPLDTVYPLLQEFRSRAKKILEGDSKSQMDMALAFYEMGLMDAARDELQRIDSADPVYLEGQCLLGEILVSEGSDLAALEVYQKCLRDSRLLDTVRCECHYQLMRLYLRLGDLKQALDQAKALQKLAPSYRDLRRQILHIEENLARSSSGRRL